MMAAKIVICSQDVCIFSANLRAWSIPVSTSNCVVVLVCPQTDWRRWKVGSETGKRRPGFVRNGAARNRVWCASMNVDENERLKDAAKGGDVETVVELLKFPEVRIDLPSPTRSGWNALHLASFYGYPEIVEVLLNAGANLEVRNESGNTALQLACLKGNIQIARMLLKFGADITAQSFDKGTALDYALEWGGEEMVDFLYLWASESSTLE